MLKLACVTLLVEGALSLLPAPRAVPQHRRVALRAGDSEWEDYLSTADEMSESGEESERSEQSE